MDQHSTSSFYKSHMGIMGEPGSGGKHTPIYEEALYQSGSPRGPGSPHGGSASGDDNGQAQEAPATPEARYRAVGEQMPATSYAFVLDGTDGSHYISPPAATILGYRQEDLRVNPELWLHSIHPDDRTIVRAEYAHRKSAQGPFCVEYRVVRADGRLIWLRDEAVIISDTGGRHRLMQGVIYDITDLKAQQQSLHEEATTQARLVAQLVSTQEAERRRIQMDIHDGPLQSLGVSLVTLGRATRRLERGEGEITRRDLQFLRETLEETMTELHSMLSELSQDVLTAQSLVPALRKQLSRFSEVTGIRVRIESDLNRPLPREYELLIFRLAQEGLSNVRKHSTAHNVAFSLLERGGLLHITIKDDGIGFDVNELERMSHMRRDDEQLGLQSMRERARALGGDLRIFSSIGRGTTLHFTCPVPVAGVAAGA